MDKCREEFEQKGNIKIFVKLCMFDDSINEYSSDKLHDYTLGFINGAWWAFQEQQKRIDEINQENEKLKLDHAAYKKGMKNIIREKLKQVEGRDFTIAAMERSLVLANAKVVELQARVDAALLEIKGAARWIDEDAINDPEFIKGGALRALKRLEQALEGGESK